ncbi:uncharacterized protein LAJ45_02290 [Morchella importuna]|uniref:uncharacterized protein n=1 Tax=Morchella importuna TaxID=1174673 RepID=UPI001E8ED15F|nr:uncharacterized protein LAJ45_02290 [Morchella importuna]KAH8153477.1 hypothetical protein LAJ45_02290 [Morchella importuna]
MPSSNSSRKRPALSTSIQPSITSFFSPASNNSCPSSLSTTNTPNTNTNPNTKTSSTITWRTNNAHESPGDIQSKLLNVGMRVRKAVPEGLKTGTYKSTKFGVVPPSQEKALSKVVKGTNNKREYQEDPEIETSMQTERPAGQISVPKSLNRTYHAAVPRGFGGDTHMIDQYESDDFEEAGFLKPVE